MKATLEGDLEIKSVKYDLETKSRVLNAQLVVSLSEEDCREYFGHGLTDAAFAAPPDSEAACGPVYKSITPAIVVEPHTLSILGDDEPIGNLRCMPQLRKIEPHELAGLVLVTLLLPIEIRTEREAGKLVMLAGAVVGVHFSPVQLELLGERQPASLAAGA